MFFSINRKYLEGEKSFKKKDYPGVFLASSPMRNQRLQIYSFREGIVRYWIFYSLSGMVLLSLLRFCKILGA